MHCGICLFMIQIWCTIVHYSSAGDACRWSYAVPRGEPTWSRRDTSVKYAKSPIIVIIITIISYFYRFSCLKLWFDFLVSCVFAFFLCSCLHCVLCGVFSCTCAAIIVVASYNKAASVKNVKRPIIIIITIIIIMKL